MVFAGPATAEERDLLADERVAGLVRSVGTLERPRTLALQRAADSLLVIAEGDSARSVATNKLYEYLAAGRPVLVLGEESEAAQTVRESGAGIVAPAGDRGGVAAALTRLVDGVQPVSPGIERFAWPALAERFEAEIPRRRSGAKGARQRRGRPRRPPAPPGAPGGRRRCRSRTVGWPPGMWSPRSRSTP